jgi:hypothetical protein
MFTINVNAKPKDPFNLRPRLNETDPDTIRRLEENITSYIQRKIIVSSLNMLLYSYLTFFYIRLYRDNASRFSLGLTGLALVLLIYSVTSNPLIIQYFRGSDPIWFIIFNLVPDLFATLAAFIMIYLSKT